MDIINYDTSFSLDSGNLSIEPVEAEKIEKLDYKNIIPQKGIFLGLDISKQSTGIFLSEDGEHVFGNIDLTNESMEIQKGSNKNHIEVLMRRALKHDLTEVVQGKDFDLIVIEDAFTGENPKVSRLLYALNTAIDELILDGVCTCKEFIRVDNKTWKKWLWNSTDPMNKLKGLNDKERIKECLSTIGIHETGVGYQDRLDATGMLIGYLLNKDTMRAKEVASGVKRVTWSQLDIRFDIDESFIFLDNPWLADLDVKFITLSKFTKKGVLDIINSSPESVFITSNYVMTGALGDSLGLGYISDGGKIVFWVKKSCRKRLFG